MSRGAGRSDARRALTIAIGAPLCAALALWWLVLSGGTRPDLELQLVAPTQVEPGRSLPLRALVFDGLSRTEGPVLADAAGEVELVSTDGAVLARVVLRAGLGPSLEGELAVPASVSGDVTLRAAARVGDRRAQLKRVVQIGRDEPAPSSLPRQATALQRLALGPLREVVGAPAPVLRVQIRGGACVPEQRCDLLVHVGAPGIVVRARATASVTPLHEDAARNASAQVARLGVVVHGPEALTELIATRPTEARPEGRDFRTVASRSVRLEVALGGARAVGGHALLPAGQNAEVGLTSHGAACIVDAFHSGHLRHSATLLFCGPGARLPFVLPTGTSKLQLRSDPFAGDPVAVWSTCAREPGELDGHALTALARSALAIDPEDLLARAIASGAADPSQAPATAAREVELAAEYLLAIHDQGVFPTPSATSSLPEAELARAAERAGHRKLGILVLALCAVALAALVAERGLRASADAQTLLADAGSTPEALRRTSLRAVLSVIATTAAVLLVFAVIAVYVIVRGRGLG